ncbi:MAG: DUF3520 domain-containing protein [Proteobacteria bacterium]|nr:DUF3520 domain-containing protein [Pseudomonadota bacterium]
MRNVMTLVVLIQMTLWISCSNGNEDDPDNNNSETGDNLPGYGDDQIGFRNDGADEEDEEGDDSSSDGDTDSDSDGDGDVDGDMDMDTDADTDSDTDIDSDTDTDEDEDPYQSNIDLAFLQDSEMAAPWYGMLYEGMISESAQDTNLFELQNVTSGVLGDFSLERNPADIVLIDEGDALVSLSSIEIEPTEEDTEPSPYRDDFVVESIFSKQDLDIFVTNPSFNQGIPTLVIRNTYEISTDDDDVLRESCVVASNRPQSEESELPGEGLCYAPDGSFDSGSFVSLAHKTPLTDDMLLVSEQYTDLFLASLPQYESQENLCVCYAEDGSTTISCDEFEGTHRPQSPPSSPPVEVVENPFYTTSEMATSTFAIDVDTGSFTLVRQHLNNGELPPAKSVRLEEMINYFKYNYEMPVDNNPFTIYTEMADCPWNDNRKLAMIGMRGQQVEMDDQPAANLVYLLDVSGSMAEELWLIKPAFRMLTAQLRPQDTLSIVTYAGNEAVVIDGATGDEKEEILTALDNLESGGSTNGAGGIQKAYELAEKHFKAGGNNRVILATDGDFNVGTSSQEGLVALIKEKVKSDVFLTVYGVATWGSGNFQDEKMEQLANNGNGTYFFLDGEAEMRRAFMHSLSGTLLTIAKDVKLQIQFNPDLVKGYRLIGYDNRTMDNDDFDDDTVDAGELGNSEDMTAFYEIILSDSEEDVPQTDVTNDPNQETETEYESLDADQFMAIRLRYKQPDSDTSELLTHPIANIHLADEPSKKFIFASTVAQLGLVLRQSTYIDNSNISSLDDRILDAFGDRDTPAVDEILMMIEKANQLLE